MGTHLFSGRKTTNPATRFVKSWPQRAVAAICLLAAFLAAGCGRRDADRAADDGTKTISIYTMQLKPTYTSYMEDVFARFEKQYPGVKVRWLDVPAQEYETKLMSLIASGKAPDVQNLPYAYMLRLNSRGLLLGLDDFISSDARASYVQSILESGCTINGQLLAVPWYLATGVTMYNRSIFEAAGLDPNKPPLNVDELFVIARQIKQKTDKFAFTMTLSEEGFLKQILFDNGIPLTNPERTKATFNTTEAVRLISEYKKLYDEGVMPREAVREEHRRAIELYKSGRTALLQSGPQFLMQIREATDVYEATDIGPAFPIGKTGKYGCDTQNLSVYVKTPYPKEALNLALWVTNAENQLAFCKMVTIFPSVKEALADPYFSQPGKTPEDMARNIGAKQMQTAIVNLPELPHLAELNKAMIETVNKIFLQNVPVESALAEAETRWTEILSKP